MVFYLLIQPDLTDCFSREAFSQEAILASYRNLSLINLNPVPTPDQKTFCSETMFQSCPDCPGGCTSSAQPLGQLRVLTLKELLTASQGKPPAPLGQILGSSG